MAKNPKKQKPPRRHHYIPKFYQRHFANSVGQLYVYDRNTQLTRELSPESVCVETNMYVLYREDGTPLENLESEFTRPIDDAASTVLNKIVAAGCVTPDQQFVIASFVALQQIRTPMFRRISMEMRRRSGEQIARIAFKDARRAAALLDRYSREAGIKVNLTPEKAVQFVASGKYTVTATETAFLMQMLHMWERTRDRLMGYTWELIKTPESTGFILCDDPIVTVPAESNKSRFIGMETPGSMTFFPLSRRYACKIVTDAAMARSKPDRVVVTGAYTVKQINCNIAANSSRFIMGPSRDQLKAVVFRSGSCLDEPERQSLSITFSNDDEAWFALETKRRRYFYS